MLGNYDKIIEKIANSSGLDNDEVVRRIEAKRAKLSGLISKEGAAQVIAAELGISFDNERLKIGELLPGMRKVNLVAKIIQLYPVRSFMRDGQEGKVANLVIADDTSNIKTVLWDVNHIELFEKNQINNGDVIEIFNASMRGNEIHLGSFSEIKPSKEQFQSIVTEKQVIEKNISDFKISDNVSTRAFVLQAFEPRFFEVCPECGKKATPQNDGSVCEVHGKVVPKRRALMNFVLDDGTETIRAVIFSDNFDSLGFTDLEDSERISVQKQELLGKEMIFSGNIRNNKFFNNPEFIVDGVKEVNLDTLIGSLEAKK